MLIWPAYEDSWHMLPGARFGSIGCMGCATSVVIFVLMIVLLLAAVAHH